LITYLQCIAAIQLTAFIVLYWGLCHNAGAHWLGLTSAVAPPIIASIFAYLGCLFVFDALNIAPIKFSLAMIYGIQFLFVYCLVLRLLFLNQLGEMIEYLPAKKIARAVFFIR